MLGKIKAVEWREGISQTDDRPVNRYSGRPCARRIPALLELLFLPVLASGTEVMLSHSQFTANCTLTPDTLVEHSDEFFCGDQPAYIQCHVPNFSYDAIALTFDGNQLSGFSSYCSNGTISGQSTLAAMEPLLSQKNWLFAVTVIQFTPYRFAQKGMNMPGVLLFPPYTPVSTTLAMPGRYSGDRQFNHSGYYPAGLPYGRYQLRLKVSDSGRSNPLTYDLRIRLDIEHNGSATNASQVLVTNGTVLPDTIPILLGPILYNMTLTPWLTGKPDCADTPLPAIGRYERLDTIEYHFAPEPEVAVQWLDVYFPDVVGPLSAITSTGQTLDSHCASGSPAGTRHCALSLAGQPPLNWLSLRAGTLPDAETLNLTGLDPFWTIGQFSPDNQGYHWQPAPIPASGYQLLIDCHDELKYQYFVVETQFKNDIGDTVRTCNLTLTPQYQQRLWEEYSLRTLIQLRYNNGSVIPLQASTLTTVTPAISTGLTKTPFMATVSPTAVTGTPTLPLASTPFHPVTVCPEEDETTSRERLKIVATFGCLTIISGAVLVAESIILYIMCRVLRMRRQTGYVEVP